MTEAERIAQELVEGIIGLPTRLEREAAALIRQQAAEIERKDKLLMRWCNDALSTEQVRDLEAETIAEIKGVRNE